MDVAANIGMILIRITNAVVNTFVLIVILLLFAFGCYSMWDLGRIHSAASPQRYERYNPTAEGGGVSFEYLQSINPDVFAWLTVYGTNIDYPVVQGQDNIRYVNVSAEGRHSLSGSIFLDHRNSSDFSDFNSIFYGHHMESRTMFGEIAMFADGGYFDARRHGMLFFDGKEHGVEFFAFIHVDAHDGRIFRVNIEDESEQQVYLDLLMDIAVNAREDVSVTVDDRIVLLSTCSPNSTNGRDILIGKITEKVQNDPFEEEISDNPIVNIPVIDELPGLWTRTSSRIRITIVASAFLLILLGVVLTYIRSTKESE